MLVKVDGIPLIADWFDDLSGTVSISRKRDGTNTVASILLTDLTNRSIADRIDCCEHVYHSDLANRRVVLVRSIRLAVKLAVVHLSGLIIGNIWNARSWVTPYTHRFVRVDVWARQWIHFRMVNDSRWERDDCCVPVVQWCSLQDRWCIEMILRWQQRMQFHFQWRFRSLSLSPTHIFTQTLSHSLTLSPLFSLSHFNSPSNVHTLDTYIGHNFTLSHLSDKQTKCCWRSCPPNKSWDCGCHRLIIIWLI